MDREAFEVKFRPIADVFYNVLGELMVLDYDANRLSPMYMDELHEAYDKLMGMKIDGIDMENEVFNKIVSKDTGTFCGWWNRLAELVALYESDKFFGKDPKREAEIARIKAEMKAREEAGVITAPMNSMTGRSNW
jgi:hypothetical protein